MSPGHVEKLRAAYEAFNRGDFDAAVKLACADAEFIRPGLEGPLRGPTAIRAWMEPDAFEELKNFWSAASKAASPAVALGGGG